MGVMSGQQPHRSFLPTRILLIDRSPAMATAWRRCFEGDGRVEVFTGDFFSQATDAMVSPANSFGIMDGGLDLAIRDALGLAVQKEAQRVILERHHGELPVGQAEMVATSHKKWPYLIIAPTMRAPESVAQTIHAYLAFRAALLAVARFNGAASDGMGRIDSIVCPGLGTGIGAMDYTRCAQQMHRALQHVSEPARIPSFREIRQQHAMLQEA